MRIKGYKATNKGKGHQLFHYEVGKTYEHKGELKHCKSGIHFCKKIDGVLDYHDYTKNEKDKTVIFEVEAFGDILDQGNKSVTNKLKIIREIPASEYNSLFEKYKFDEKGNIIYNKDVLDTVREFKYDEIGNIIYSKSTHEGYIYEHWKEYDEKGNITHSKDNEGYETWLEYNENGKLIHEKDSKGDESWSYYDKVGNCVSQRMSDLREWHKEYDERNNEIHYKDSTDYEIWQEYDENNKLTHYRITNGFELFNEYDKNSNLIHSWSVELKREDIVVDSVTGERMAQSLNEPITVVKRELWYKYDENNNCVYLKDLNGNETYEVKEN